MLCLVSFFFNDTATTEIYTLSLHDALPILTEEEFSRYLFVPEDIDLMIRTSGELRISNYLLWQLAYAELIFTPVAWPDFDEKALKDCLDEFASRDRRFGGLTS